MHQQRVHIQRLVQRVAGGRGVTASCGRRATCPPVACKQQHRAPLRRAAGCAGASRDACQGCGPGRQQVHGQRRGGTVPATVQWQRAASRLAAVALALPPAETAPSRCVLRLGRRLRVGLLVGKASVRSDVAAFASGVGWLSRHKAQIQALWRAAGTPARPPRVPDAHSVRRRREPRTGACGSPVFRLHTAFAVVASGTPAQRVPSPEAAPDARHSRGTAVCMLDTACKLRAAGQQAQEKEVPKHRHLNSWHCAPSAVSHRCVPRCAHTGHKARAEGAGVWSCRLGASAHSQPRATRPEPKPRSCERARSKYPLRTHHVVDSTPGAWEPPTPAAHAQSAARARVAAASHPQPKRAHYHCLQPLIVRHRRLRPRAGGQHIAPGSQLRPGQNVQSREL